ncbi:MAG: hypothetical protein K2X87_25455 [Gemmataceae bacterium]|nr:hypothetical protein [Gemmataceae bacterium]
MATYSTPLSQWFYNGAPASGATVTVYQSGTTNPVTIYTDAALSVPASNPLTCDANGEAKFYCDVVYALRLYVQTATGTLIRDVDPVYPVPVTTGLTATGTELNRLAVVTAGTVTASKAVVVDSSKNVEGFNKVSTTEGAISPYGMDKNLLIGGDFGTNPWQRGTTFAAAATTQYTADRWIYLKSGATVHTITRDTDVPTVGQAGRLVTHSLRLNLTTPDTAIAAGDFCGIAQRIEGYVFTAAAQRSFTISFWVKATATGTYSVACRNSGSDRTYVGSYDVNTTATWERKTVTVTASPTGGTWDYATGLGLEVFWALAAGSTYQALAGVWQTGSYYAGLSQVNGVNTGATDFRLALVQLEPGPADTKFDSRSVQQELARCQRYFFKTYNQGTAPGANVGTDSAGAFQFRMSGTSASAHALRQTVSLPVSLRTTGTFAFYSTDGTVNNVRDRVAAGNISATVQSAGERSVVLDATTGSSADCHVEGHLTASAEL